MLVLTRKVGEEIVIGENVTLTVLEVAGTRVKLGVKAPSDVPVHRAEVHHRIVCEESALECAAVGSA